MKILCKITEIYGNFMCNRKLWNMCEYAIVRSMRKCIF